MDSVVARQPALSPLHSPIIFHPHHQSLLADCLPIVALVGLRALAVNPECNALVLHLESVEVLDQKKCPTW